LGQHVNYFDIGDFQGVGRGSAQDQECVKHDPMLVPHPHKRRLDPLSNNPPIAESLHYVQLVISSFTWSLVQNGSFVALSQQEVHVSEIDRGVEASPHSTEWSEESENGNISLPCEPHKCLSCR
jgi:hypothetical protein